MNHRHPIIALLLLLAILPAVAGGCLTQLCSCGGFFSVAGCYCRSNNTPDAAGAPLQANSQNCRGLSCGCGSHAPANEGDQAPDTPTEPEHSCSHLAYQMNISILQTQLPPCPVALLHESCIPLPVWLQEVSVEPSEPLHLCLSQHGEHQLPLLL